MTVAAFPPYTYYWGDGVTTAFAYPFEVERPEDFLAYVDDVLVSNYTLSGLGNETGGTCTFSAPVAAGASLLLLRQVPLDQETMYPAYSPFPAAAHEKTLDRLCMQVWQLQEQLERTTRFRQTIRPPWRNLEYPDPLPNTVLGWDSAGEQWTLYPTGVTAIPVDPVSGIGWGKNTIELVPVAGSAQATGLLFPAGVLALAVSAWVHTSLGTSQGLQQVGVGTPAQPDCWGLLPGLAAETTTSAGLFQSYSGQPQLPSGVVSLTAYGGHFDGTGSVYVTGHFQTFGAATSLGYSYHSGAADASQPLPPVNVPLASELEPGIAELATAAEVATGTDPSRIVTPLRLSEQLTPLRATDTTHTTQIAALDAKLPAGTPLSVARYGSGGTALEASSATVSAAGDLTVTTTGTNLGLTLVSEHTTTTGAIIMDAYQPSAGAMSLSARKAHGTLAAPTRLTSTDNVFNLNMQAWLRNAGDTADAWVNMAQLRSAVESVDAQGRGGGSLSLWVGPGVSASPVEALRVTQASNLLLGATTHGTSLTKGLALGNGTAPTTSPADQVQLWAADLNAGAGQSALHLRTETGALYVFGATAGFGTHCTATLGSGAAYRTLNVTNSQMFVRQSTTQERPVALLDAPWVVNTDASRTGRLTLSVYDSVAAREGLRIEASGTAPLLGFYGANAVAKPTVSGSRGGNAALASALSALASLGLVVDSSTA